MKTEKGKVEIAEDYCFSCKDGGLLLVCDHKDCLKAYHPLCVDKDDSFLDKDEHWTCGWHSCHICHKSSTYRCTLCPISFCRLCLDSANFGSAKNETKGFCNNCLKLAILIEEKLDVDSDGGNVDFEDKETYEFLFKEYWDIVKEQEGLTLADLQAADGSIRSRDKHSKKSKSGKLSEDDLFSPDHEEETECGGNSLCLDPKTNHSISKRKSRAAKSKKKRFNTWCSEHLAQFLSSIGKSSVQPLSQLDVSEIVKRYIKDNNLANPDKRKRKIFCDVKLHALFRRKALYIHKIYPLLESHLAENKESEDELHLSSADELVVCKRQREPISHSIIQRPSPDHSIQEAYRPPKRSYACMIGKNIGSIYLRRSLMVELIKKPEALELKVVGCFVRVKSDPKDLYYSHEKVYRLGQVLGVKKADAYNLGETSTDIVLEVSNMSKDIRLHLLSDDDFREEECCDLQLLMKKGLIKKITIEDLEKKIRIVHEDIVNHWINKEISKLQKQIDQANVKGWRKELFEYVDRRKLLQTPAERSRLLNEMPGVVADAEEGSIEHPVVILEDEKEPVEPPPGICNTSACGGGICDVKSANDVSSVTGIAGHEDVGEAGDRPLMAIGPAVVLDPENNPVR